VSDPGSALEAVFEGDVLGVRPPWGDHKGEISEGHTQRWEYLHCDCYSTGCACDPNFLDEDFNAVDGGEVF
jgi:hypothetical protein